MKGGIVARRTLVWGGWVLAGVDAVMALAALIAGLAGAVELPADLSEFYPNLVFALTLPSLGAVVLRRAPGNRLGPLYLASGTATALALGCYAYAYYGLAADPGALPGALAVGWVSAWVWALGAVPLITLGVLWYPDGMLPGPRWRAAELAAVLAVTGLVLASMIEPGPLVNHPVRDNPLGVAAAEGAVGVVGALSFALVVASLLAGVAALAVRWRRGDQVRRAQIRWLLVAVALLALAASVPRRGAIALAVDLLTLIAVPMVPAALAVAILRYRVYGSVIIRRSLTYGVLSVLLLAVYIALVAGAHALFGQEVDPGAALVAAGVVAALSAPLRSRLQDSVDRLVYGQRGDPYAALTSLGRRLQEAGTPEGMLQDVVATVAEALRAPYAAVELGEADVPAARVGHRGGPEQIVPLFVHGQQVGRLVVAQRTEKDRYSTADLALLADLARHLGVAAQSVLLTRDLQGSRERLVLAREEERRRVSRDLHDGLGPALAGIAFGMDAVRNGLPSEAEDADAELRTLKAEVQECLADVRRLVNDLRPPVLDQLGLVPAVQECAARLSERGALRVSVDACPASLPVLPAAVEVAAYRIITEALNNTARHARAKHAVVRLHVREHSVELEVVDDGVGLNGPPPPRRTGGVGLAAMAERAAEVGGSCLAATGPAGGTAVRAVLPISEPT